MPQGILLHQGENGYTYLKKIFQCMHDFQKDYNWLITDCEAYPENPKHAARLYQSRHGGYTWMSGGELTRLIYEDDFQWIWAVLSGFAPTCSMEDVLKYPLPCIRNADRDWNKAYGIQHPLASVELSAWDSSYTIFFSHNKSLIQRFQQSFPLGENLTKQTDSGAGSHGI